MKTKLLMIIFGACFVAWVVAATPFAALMTALDLQSRGITYTRAEGSLWSGRITGLVWRGHGLGDMAVDVKPLWLLLGRLDADIAFDGKGAVSGQGRIAFHAGGRATANDLKLVADVSILPSVLPMRGTMTIDVRHGDLSARGCHAMDAVVRTNALVDRPAGLSWRGPVLEGTATCPEGALTVPLTGSNGAEIIVATMTVLSDGAFRIQVDAQTMDQSVIAALTAAGFTYAGGKMTLVQNGRWG